MDFALPDIGAGERWDVAIDTASPLREQAEGRAFKTGEPIEVDARSILVLRRVF
jgi:hypothetical protein